MAAIVSIEHPALGWPRGWPGAGNRTMKTKDEQKEVEQIFKDLRALRNAVLGILPGDPIHDSDRNWESCRENWPADVDWLTAQSSRIK